ncbi:MAG: efflux RND transporter periplasmic adaptor subunit [Verrucomicrobiota bacterium]
MKWVFILVAAAALAGVGFYIWKKSQTTKTEYKTASIARGDLIQVVTASGQLNPVVTVQVGSQISGILQKLYVDFNSPVTNGQIVAQIDPASYQANLQQSEAELDSAKAGLELIRLNAERAKALYTDSLLPKADYDKSVADLHQSESTVKIRQALVEKAKVDLGRTTIFSTIDGVVMSREVDVGQTVAASMNAPVLFKIANDLAKMQIDAMVSEADVGGVELGQDVTFTVDAFPMRTFRGKVIQVRNSPVTTQSVVTYDTVIEVNNRDLKLKPGMTANVSVIVAHKENVLKIPNAALRVKLPDASAKAVSPTSTPTSMSATPTNGMAQGGGRSGGRSRGGGGGGSGPPGARSGAARAERSGPKTIYLAEKKIVEGETVIEPKPVQIKTGIGDGLFTEILEGLNEKDEVVVGVILPESEAPKAAVNPFGGSSRGFGR